MKRIWLAASGPVIAGAACAAPPPAPEPSRGETLYRQCFACHALEPGANTPAGPTLFGIVGQPIAAEPEFNYSPALRRLAAEEARWSPELLDRFLEDPDALAPGTEMGFAGIESESDRATLIDWFSERSSRRR